MLQRSRYRRLVFGPHFGGVTMPPVRDNSHKGRPWISSSSSNPRSISSASSGSTCGCGAPALTATWGCARSTTRRRPSFTVHVVHQFYKCFSCGAGGDVVKFVQEIEGLSFYEALKSLWPSATASPCRSARGTPTKIPNCAAPCWPMHEQAAGELSRPSEIAARGGGARLPGQARTRAGDRRAVRPGLLGPLGPRAGAPLRAARIPRAQMEAVGPGAASGRMAASTTASATG